MDRKEYSDPFNDAEDLAGARIVCLFMVDLERTGDVISSMFEVINREDKIAEGGASTFGYMSHHYVCRLSDCYAGERYDPLKGLKFEIQVRTILMDAWANMSHHLSYKNEESIPKGLIKDFHALSGLLYVGDRQFESLCRASSRSAATAEDRVLRSAEIAESEVNADTVNALLARVYSDRIQPSVEAVSDFTFELRETGFEDLAEVGEILERNKGVAVEREKRSFIVRSRSGKPDSKRRFSRVGLARAAFDAHDPEFAAYREKRFEKKLSEDGPKSKPQSSVRG